MIVADVNLMAYLLILGERSAAAEAVLARDPEWAVPLLWRSEWRSVLAGYLRAGTLTFEAALEYIEIAESLVRGREHMVEGAAVMDLVRRSTCAAYDCEYVVLAEQLGVPLLTSDLRILREFPGRAVALEAFG